MGHSIPGTGWRNWRGRKARPRVRGPVAALLQPFVAKLSSFSLKNDKKGFLCENSQFQKVSEHFIPSNNLL